MFLNLGQLVTSRAGNSLLRTSGQKLHIKFDLRPPGFGRHYQAVIGNCDWLTAWELALLCEHSLWAVHRRFDNEVNCLKSFGPAFDKIVENEYKTFRLVLRNIGNYPKLVSKLAFYQIGSPTSHERLLQLKSSRGVTPRASPSSSNA